MSMLVVSSWLVASRSSSTTCVSGYCSTVRQDRVVDLGGVRPEQRDVQAQDEDAVVGAPLRVVGEAAPRGLLARTLPMTSVSTRLDRYTSPSTARPMATSRP